MFGKRKNVLFGALFLYATLTFVSCATNAAVHAEVIQEKPFCVLEIPATVTVTHFNGDLVNWGKSLWPRNLNTAKTEVKIPVGNHQFVCDWIDSISTGTEADRFKARAILVSSKTEAGKKYRIHVVVNRETERIWLTIVEEK